MLPTVFLEGRLVSDPVVRFTQNGTAVASMRVACNSRVKDQNGTWQDGESCFLDLTAWKGLAENAAENFRKGSLVLVSGRLGQRVYEAADGTKRTAYEVTADSLGPALSNKVDAPRPAVNADDPWANQTQDVPF